MFTTCWCANTADPKIVWLGDTSNRFAEPEMTHAVIVDQAEKLIDPEGVEQSG